MLRKVTVLLIIAALASCRPEAARVHTAGDDSLPKPPVMGWSSWNNFRAGISEEIIKAQADAMVRLKLTEAGYTYINIDDGFFGGRDSSGRIVAHRVKFPGGMKSLADYIHSKGLKAGIYTDAGINTCASYWDNDTIGMGMGLFGHDERDLRQYLLEWDYDFLKVDWCGGEWLGLDEESRYTAIGQIVRKIKPSVVYNVCRWKFPGEWVAPLADSWRISGDISNNFSSILHIIDLNAGLWKYCSPGHYNDMDMLQVGRGMTFEEDKTHFTMWCMMHSPLLLGNDLTKISDETLEIITNKEVIALNQSPFVYQARRMGKPGETEIWAKPLISAMSGEVAVAMLNRTPKEREISFQPDSVGVASATGYSLKDLWSGETVPQMRDAVVKRNVPPHGVVVLRIKGESLPGNPFQYGDKWRN